MALPLYLAMTPSEMSSIEVFPNNFAYMAYHFSPYSQGLSNLPASLPKKAILILNDNFPCQGHCPSLVADQLKTALNTFHCESLLLDFQRPSTPETEQMVQTIVAGLTQPVVLPPAYTKDWDGPVFLPPCPLHMSLQEYLKPWKEREIWMEAALCQEDAVVTGNGTNFIPQFPSQGLNGGFFDESLCCNYRINSDEHSITFTLFDTNHSLEKKLSLAQALGVCRAIGLYQELGHSRPDSHIPAAPLPDHKDHDII